MRIGPWVVAVALTVAIAAVTWRALARAGSEGGPWRRAAAHLRTDRGARLALVVIVGLVVVAAFAPWLAGFDPSYQPDIVALKAQAPSLAHPLGTDLYSRDVLSRLVHGARISLSVALLSVALAVTIGTAYGGVAGYYGGHLDNAMMRLIDAALSVPRILLLIAVLALWGSVSLPALVVLLGVTGWFGVSRLVRAQVLAAREQEWVQAARALGAGNRRILWRHILPNAVAPVIVAASLGIGHVIIVEAGLSYLGFGVQQPTPSWGNMIREGADVVPAAAWLSLAPGAAIALTVLAFNLLGEALRDALDPRQVTRS